MSEYIGAKISLISRSDIRYVGTLHEINSENSTVALEQVISYGTEGRRGDPEKEIPRTDTVYEYIVFRGSDVKDLRIEEAAKPQPPKPQVPDDPAILGTTQPPSYNRAGPGGPGGPGGAPASGPPQMPPQPQFQQPPPGPPFYGQPMRPPPNQFYNPYQQQPQYGQFMQQPPAFPSQIAPQHPGALGGRGPTGPFGGPGFPPQQPQQSQQQQQPPQAGAAQQPGAPKQQTPGPGQGPSQAPQPIGKPAPAGSKPATPVPQADGPSQGPIKDTEKPSGPPTGPAKGKQGPPPFGLKQGVPSGPKNARPTNVAPALPLASPARPPAELVTKPAKVEESDEKQPGSADAAAVQELAKKVSQLNMSPTSTPKVPQGPANGTRANGNYPQRGGRGRGGFRDQTTRKVEVPASDYDFDAANAKFNKQDLVKEVIATGPADPVSPVATPNGDQIPAATAPDVAVPASEPSYNRGKSFFDNISCENKDRAEGADGRRGWRGEEQRKNLETFGQGSVDSYGGNRYGRGGWRGRGRGGYRRGGGYGGRGGGFNNRGQQTVGPQ